MQVFRDRPLALICCVYAVCALAAVNMNIPLLLCGMILFAMASVAFLIVFLLRRQKWSFLLFACALAVVLATASSLFCLHVPRARYEPYLNQTVQIEGTVLERVDSTPYSTLLTIELNEFQGKDCRQDAAFECAYASALQVGDRFGATVTLADVDSLRFLCSDFKHCEIFPEPSDSIRIWFIQRNMDLSYRLQHAVGDEEGRLASALLLGNRDELTAQTILHFNRTGITHLLALSGLHVSVLIALADWLLRRCRCPRLGRAIIVASFSLFYLFLTGCSPSAARAVCMACLVSVALCVQEEYDSFTALSLALALLLLLSPEWVTDLRLWMSFTAAGAIVTFLPMLSNPLEALYQKWFLPTWTFKCVSYIISGLFIGIVANLAMMPILAFFMGNLSLLSVPMTLILSIPMTLTLILAILTLLFPPIGVLCRLCAAVMLWIAEKGAELDHILIPMNDLATLILALLVGLFMVSLAVLKWKRPLLWGIAPLALAILAIITSVCVTQIKYNGITAHYISESGGDVLLFTERGRAVAIDFSDGSADGAYQLTVCAKNARCMQIDDLVITHYHNQATHFISTVASNLSVRRLRLSPPQTDWERTVAMRMCEVAERYHIAVCFDTSELALDNLKCDTSMRQSNESELHPALLYSWSVNGQRLTYMNCSVAQSPYGKAAEKLMESTTVLMIGGTGYSTVLEQTLPYVPKSDITTIVLANEKLLTVLPSVPDTVAVYTGAFPITFHFP